MRIASVRHAHFAFVAIFHESGGKPPQSKALRAGCSEQLYES